MCIPSRPTLRRRIPGLSLIELLMFIVIVSFAVVGVLQVMNLNVHNSVDPLLQKQAMAIAEALLEEIEQMPFTDCDPDGYDAEAASCVKVEEMGPEAYANQGGVDEAWGDPVAPFDNVNDYNNFTLVGNSTDLGGAANVVVPIGYRAHVAITNEADFGPAGSKLANTEVLRITVTVAYKNTDIVVLEGYRTKYAPTP